jgi:hypothetical protein
MLAKAVHLQKAKDNPGNPLPSSDFVLLSSLSDDHLLDVASDSALALVLGVGSCVDLLSLVRTKEIAQAALAQAQVKFVDQKADEEAATAAAAQAIDTGPSVAQCPAPASVDLPPQAPVVPEAYAPKLSRAKSSKQTKQACSWVLHKTPTRQARVSLRGVQMKVFISNIRGFGRRGRRNQLKYFCRINKVDIIFLQETIQQDFSLAELDSLEVGDKFLWAWLPANGHSGGLLVGFRDSVFEIGSTFKGSFLVATQVCVKASRFLFEFVGVYGLADHSHSAAFLSEQIRWLAIPSTQWWSLGTLT